MVASVKKKGPYTLFFALAHRWTVSHIFSSCEVLTEGCCFYLVLFLKWSAASAACNVWSETFYGEFSKEWLCTLLWFGSPLFIGLVARWVCYLCRYPQFFKRVVISASHWLLWRLFLRDCLKLVVNYNHSLICETKHWASCCWNAMFLWMMIVLLQPGNKLPCMTRRLDLFLFFNQVTLL